jgi:hypothetical protein
MSTRRPIGPPRSHTSHAQALATSPCHAREAQCRCCMHPSSTRSSFNKWTEIFPSCHESHDVAVSPEGAVARRSHAHGSALRSQLKGVCSLISTRRTRGGHSQANTHARTPFSHLSVTVAWIKLQHCNIHLWAGHNAIPPNMVCVVAACTPRACASWPAVHADVSAGRGFGDLARGRLVQFVSWLRLSEQKKMRHFRVWVAACNPFAFA